MSAKDYEICPALFSAYIAKVSKRNPNKMTNDGERLRKMKFLVYFIGGLRKRPMEKLGIQKLSQ